MTILLNYNPKATMANIEAKDLVPGKVYATTDLRTIFRLRSIRKRLEEVTVNYVTGQHIEIPISSTHSGIAVHQSHKFQEVDEAVLFKALKAKEIAEVAIQAIFNEIPTKYGPKNDGKEIQNPG